MICPTFFEFNFQDRVTIEEDFTPISGFIYYALYIRSFADPIYIYIYIYAQIEDTVFQLGFIELEPYCINLLYLI